MDIGGVVHAFFNNAGPGGVFALLVVVGACALYYFLTHWILAGGRENDLAETEESSESRET